MKQAYAISSAPAGGVNEGVVKLDPVTPLVTVPTRMTLAGETAALVERRQRMMPAPATN
jgi:hypothetical protein